MKLLHAADLHLDSPLRGLSRYEGAPAERIRAATRRALENLVAFARDEQVDLCVIAGDLFDGDWRDYSTGLFFAAQMADLMRADIPVVIVRGNHDAASQITRNLALPDNVRVLSDTQPETVEYADIGVAVHGQSFAQRVVTDDLAAKYPQALPDRFNIGLLHTCATGRAGHENYAPCQIETLRSKGYDYWALGHVHTREILSEDPWVVFPGNIQGRHARETGPKGATLVEFDRDGVQRVEHRQLDVVRWRRLEVDVSEVDHADAAIDVARRALENAVDEADGRLVAARVVLRGRSGAHEELRADPDRFIAQLRADALGVGELWIERVLFETSTTVDVDAVAQRDDPLGGLVRGLRDLREDQAALQELAEEFIDLERKLPRALRDGPDALRITEVDTIRSSLADVEQMLVPELLSGDG